MGEFECLGDACLVVAQGVVTVLFAGFMWYFYRVSEVHQR